MAVSLGKRKTRDEAEEPDNNEDENDLRARFQRAFEAKFRPLDASNKSAKLAKQVVEDEDESLDDEESGWSGLSDEDEDDDLEDDEDDEDDESKQQQIEIIDHGSTRKSEDEDRAYEKKAFMSSKVPTSSSSTRTQPSTRKQTSQPSTTDDPEEATNRAHDLALQRLLSESHLLDPSNFTTSTAPMSPSASSSPSTTPTGKSRLKALDLRLRALGSKSSLSADQQAKMPMGIRKGIDAKAARKEAERRREARENGVVLERVTGGKGVKGKAERERREGRGRGRGGGYRGGVGAPGVGRMRGGTLQLSRRDVKEIQGSSGRGRGGRGGGRGGRGGGGRGGKTRLDFKI